MVDVRRPQATASRAKAQTTGAKILRLDAGARQGHLHRVPHVGWPLQELRGGPKRRQARRVDSPAQLSSSCEYAIDWNDRRWSSDGPCSMIAARCSGVE